MWEATEFSNLSACSISPIHPTLSSTEKPYFSANIPISFPNAWPSIKLSPFYYILCISILGLFKDKAKSLNLKKVLGLKKINFIYVKSTLLWNTLYINEMQIAITYPFLNLCVYLNLPLGLYIGFFISASKMKQIIIYLFIKINF